LEEGTFYPYWELRSVGMPNWVVKKHCYLDAHAGNYQLCSAYPWDKRELTHGLLHVRSVPFVLGMVGRCRLILSSPRWRRLALSA
jgi:hypothetical protein